MGLADGTVWEKEHGWDDKWSKRFHSDKSEVWLITPNDDEAPFEIIGEQIAKNKCDYEIKSGYMFYFKTSKGLRKFSAFHYSIEQLS